MKYSVGYRSGNSSFLVSSIASVGLVALFCTSAMMSKKDSGVSAGESLENFVQDCSDSEDIEVYSSIYNGSYFLIK